MKRKGTRWRVDWFGQGNSPEPGQLVMHVSPGGTESFARVTSVRVVANRSPLPAGASCRYLVSVDRIAPVPRDQVVWVCHGYARQRATRDHDPSNDPMSPLL